jgi:hypothetical protein
MEGKITEVNPMINKRFRAIKVMQLYSNDSLDRSGQISRELVHTIDCVIKHFTEPDPILSAIIQLDHVEIFRKLKLRSIVFGVEKFPEFQA